MNYASAAAHVLMEVVNPRSQTCFFSILSPVEPDTRPPFPKGINLEKLFGKTRGILTSCDCEDACFSCLKHYYNKQFHNQLDRHAALDLLDYAMNGTVRNHVSDGDARDAFASACRSDPG